MPDQDKTDNVVPEDRMKAIANKISEVHNILIALSSDPSVDEIAAAIGLSICLDRAGKRATSIYSGKTPNALEFLKPEETFETTADVLQDFVIALNKEKADHLRYKLDGDFVKIFITPYKNHIGEEDLEFSYGDFNIEFVLALNVANGVDLDDALREHGRVMHDATVANITTGNPGKFGDIEWSDKTASSVSEMAAKLLYSIGGKDALTGEEATAFLTGIVSATDHFSNAKTTAAALQIASELMKSGADRQLVADNISLGSDNMFLYSSKGFKEDSKKDESPSSLTIEHDSESTNSEPDSSIEPVSKEGEEKTTAEASSTEPSDTSEKPEDSSLLADLQAVAAGLAKDSVTTPEATNEPLRIDAAGNEVVSEQPSPSTLEPSPTFKSSLNSTAPTPAPDFAIPTASEVNIAPSVDFATDASSENSNKYGQMLEEALAEASTPSPSKEPTQPTMPDMSAPELVAPIPEPTSAENTFQPPIPQNPALAAAPVAPTAPEINGVPEINYMPASNDEVLPPPPTPPIDFNNMVMPPQNTP